MAEQLEQATILMEDKRVKPTTAFVDLGYRGVDADNPDVHIVHRGKSKRINEQHRKLLRRRQAIEPIIGHLKGIPGDRLHAMLCAAGYNIRWLLRMIALKGVTFLWRLYLRLRLLTALVSPWPLAPCKWLACTSDATTSTLA